MRTRRHVRGWRSGLANVALAATLVVGPGGAAAAQAQEISEAAVKAAFLFNFAKFAEWPALPARGPIGICLVGGDAIAAAVIDTVRGQRIGDHALEVSRPQNRAMWQACHLLFIAGDEVRRSADGLNAIRQSPVLTVSDGRDFSAMDGIIELFIENGRMRFAINVDAANRSGVRLSSRLLGLARIIRDGHAK